MGALPVSLVSALLLACAPGVVGGSTIAAQEPPRQREAVPLRVRLPERLPERLPARLVAPQGKRVLGGAGAWLAIHDVGDLLDVLEDRSPTVADALAARAWSDVDAGEPLGALSRSLQRVLDASVGPDRLRVLPAGPRMLVVERRADAGKPDRRTAIQRAEARLRDERRVARTLLAAQRDHVDRRYAFELRVLELEPETFAALGFAAPRATPATTDDLPLPEARVLGDARATAAFFKQVKAAGGTRAFAALPLLTGHPLVETAAGQSRAGGWLAAGRLFARGPDRATVVVDLWRESIEPPAERPAPPVDAHAVTATCALGETVAVPVATSSTAAVLVLATLREADLVERDTGR